MNLSYFHEHYMVFIVLVSKHAMLKLIRSNIFGKRCNKIYTVLTIYNPEKNNLHYPGKPNMDNLPKPKEHFFMFVPTTFSQYNREID